MFFVRTLQRLSLEARLDCRALCSGAASRSARHMAPVKSSRPRGSEVSISFCLTTERPNPRAACSFIQQNAHPVSPLRGNQPAQPTGNALRCSVAGCSLAFTYLTVFVQIQGNSFSSGRIRFSCIYRSEKATPFTLGWNL